MKIYDEVKAPDYRSWIKRFVHRVLKNGGLEFEQVHIVDLTPKRIYLCCDGVHLLIRTWNYFPCERDYTGKVCSEIVQYTLFEAYSMDDSQVFDWWIQDGEVVSGNGEEIYRDVIKIQWDN